MVYKGASLVSVIVEGDVEKIVTSYTTLAFLAPRPQNPS